MGFSEDLKLEEFCYKEYIKPYLIKNNWDMIFVRYESENKIFPELQKINDIDIIVDTGTKNVAISLKTVRKKYDAIFFETVSNTNTNSKGWGYYSKADFIFYSFLHDNKCDTYSFKVKDILALDLSELADGWGETYIEDKVAYKTKGKVIPLNKFKNKKII